MQVKDELRVLVEAEVARAIENFKKLSDGVDESEKKTVSLGEALDSLSKKSLVISGVLGGAGIAAIKFAGENQKLQLSLKNMLGSAEEASVVFEEWRKLGASPGLNADEVFTLGKAMVNMGHETQYATDTIKMLGDIAAGTGASFGELSGSFERARAMGNLTTRDLVRLQQQGIPIVKQLSKELNTSEENIKQMAAEGIIGFAEMERAFKSMTAPGGQFAGMMDELSGGVLAKFSSAAADAKQALASFGELLLPMATEVLNGASSMLQGITNMDDSTKRFILTMSGIIAVSGPAIKAVKSIHAAITMLAANPVILGIAGVTAGVGLLISAFTDVGAKLDKASKDYESSLNRMARSNQSIIQSGSFEEASRQIKGLTQAMYDAARETGNFAAANSAAERVMQLNQKLNNLRREAETSSSAIKSQVQGIIEILETPINTNSSASNWLEEELYGYSTEIGKIETALERLNAGFYNNLNSTLYHSAEWAEAVASQSIDAMVDVLKKIGVSPAIQAEIDSIHKELFELGSGSTIKPNVTVTPNITTSKKTWQEWFGEITNIDHTQIGNSGAKAAQLYIDEFERGLTAQSTIAQVLGDQLDVAGVLRSRQSEVQNALVELFSIDPEQINRPFSRGQIEIENLIKEYEKLGEEAKKLENSLLITDTLQNLSKEVKNLGRDQYDLALATMAAANATAEEMEQAEKMIDTLRGYGQSFDDFLSQKISSGLMNVFPELEKQAAQAIGNISAQLASISFDSMLTGLSALGELFAKGKDGVDDFKQAMADMAQQILDQLPNMFLQAGLQLIAQGQWQLGLGFIAAAGSTAIISGFVRGKKDVTANAQGNAFDANDIIPFAAGGTFTNQIVNTPTFFKFGGKLGVMGEAGPESIMPLKRMSNGDLGVAASGGGANVTVNIINNARAEVRKEEYTDSDGNKQIDVIIEQIVNNYITSGKADRAMTRYGSRPAGI